MPHTPPIPILSRLNHSLPLPLQLSILQLVACVAFHVVFSQLTSTLPHGHFQDSLGTDGNALARTDDIINSRRVFLIAQAYGLKLYELALFWQRDDLESSIDLESLRGYVNVRVKLGLSVDHSLRFVELCLFVLGPSARYMNTWPVWQCRHRYALFRIDYIILLPVFQSITHLNDHFNDLIYDSTSYFHYMLG